MAVHTAGKLIVPTAVPEDKAAPVREASAPRHAPTFLRIKNRIASLHASGMAPARAQLAADDSSRIHTRARRIGKI